LYLEVPVLVTVVRGVDFPQLIESKKNFKVIVSYAVNHPALYETVRQNARTKSELEQI